MRLLRREVQCGTMVAVFRLDFPELRFGPDGQEIWVEETIFTRASLEVRLKNLRASGHPAPVTAAALAGWPDTKAAEAVGRGNEAGPNPCGGP